MEKKKAKRRQGKEKVRNNWLLVVAIIIFVVAAILFVIAWYEAPIDRQSVTVKYIVSDKAGFDVTTSSLNFGAIMPGGSGMRKIILRNERDFPVYYKLIPSENLAGRMVLNESKQFLGARQNLTLDISLQVPVDAAKGNYTGSLNVLVFR
jgi:hypothetical protein